MRVIEQSAKLLSITVPKDWHPGYLGSDWGEVVFELQTDYHTTRSLLSHPNIMGKATVWHPDLEKNELRVIKPKEFHKEEPGPLERASEEAWFKIMREAEAAFKFLLDNGCTQILAETVLPMAREEQITISANLLEWQGIFRTHATGMLSPLQTRELMWLALRQLIDSPVGSMFQGIADEATCGGG